MMGTQPLINYISALWISLSMGLVMVPVGSTQAEEKPAENTIVSSNTQSLESLLDISFQRENDDNSQPKKTVGASSRDAGQCVNQPDSQPLTLLVPTNAMPLTVAQRPTFFVYFPQTMAQEAELSLRDERGNGVYQTTMALSETSGIMGIQLPDTVPGLEIGETYQWSVAMICDRDDRLRDIVVDGFIKRIEPTEQLTRQLDHATTISEKVLLYAQHGIWYDTVSTLASVWLESEDLTVVNHVWKHLLSSESVQLEDMLEIPLIQPQIGGS